MARFSSVIEKFSIDYPVSWKHIGDDTAKLDIVNFEGLVMPPDGARIIVTRTVRRSGEAGDGCKAPEGRVPKRIRGKVVECDRQIDSGRGETLEEASFFLPVSAVSFRIRLFYRPGAANAQTLKEIVLRMAETLEYEGKDRKR